MTLKVLTHPRINVGAFGSNSGKVILLEFLVCDCYVFIVSSIPHIILKYYWEIMRQDTKFFSIFLHVLFF